VPFFRQVTAEQRLKFLGGLSIYTIDQEQQGFSDSEAILVFRYHIEVRARVPGNADIVNIE